MQEYIATKIRLMLKRYEKLGLTDSWLYRELQHDLANQDWLNEVAATLSEITNSEKIFDIVSQINAAEGDHRVMTMFAEYNTAKRLTGWARGFFGTFTKAEYLPRKNTSQPDFKAWNGNSVMPVETKTLGAGVGPIELPRFEDKFLKKIWRDALPQLGSFYREAPFDEGIIFIWTQQYIQTSDPRAHAYNELRQRVEGEIDMTDYPFDVQIITMFANPLDLWGFRLRRRTPQV